MYIYIYIYTYYNIRYIYIYIYIYLIMIIVHLIVHARGEPRRGRGVPVVVLQVAGRGVPRARQHLERAIFCTVPYTLQLIGTILYTLYPIPYN